MKMIALPVLALALMGAAEDTPPVPKGAAQPAPLAATPAPPSPEQCRDRITQAREAAGKPPLIDRGNAAPEKPPLIYALDKRVEGCSAMVMLGDPSDIRPLPARPDGPARIVPLGAGK